jgi:molybdopterin/thiamine biosynthesis adenylyltransferase
VTARRDAGALLVGMGGLGCPAAIALARAGVGTLGLCDDDAVELTNLHRQILFSEDDVGKHKVAAAGAALARRFAGLTIRGTPMRLLPENAVQIVSKYDVVLEGSDNFATKFLAADACAIARVPIVHAAAVRWHGTAFAVGREGRPCYRCIFEDLLAGDAPNCAEAGVVGPMAGVVGAIQADLALSILDGEGVFGTLVTFDGKIDTFRRRTIAPRAGCPLCGERSIQKISRERYISEERQHA